MPHEKAQVVTLMAAPKPNDGGEVADARASSKVAPSEPAGPAGDSNPRQTLARFGLRQLRRIAELAPKVTGRGQAKPVHDFRVASRRLESVLSLIFPPPQASEIKKLSRQMRRARRTLSEVRDSDALLERIQVLLARKRVARRDAWRTVAHYLAARRKEALRRAQRKLIEADLPQVQAELRERLEGVLSAHTPGKARNGSDRPSAREFWAQSASVSEEVRQALVKRFGRALAHPKPRTLHQARIAAKRARYLAENLRELGTPEAAEAVAWLREAQRRLGDWHDLSLLEEVMIEVIARRRFLRDHLEQAMEIERLIAENRRKRKKLLVALERRMETGLERIQKWLGQAAASPSEATPRGGTEEAAAAAALRSTTAGAASGGPSTRLTASFN